MNLLRSTRRRCFVSEQSWDHNDPNCLTMLAIEKITEFRGLGRTRYMTRQRDPNDPSLVLEETARCRRRPSGMPWRSCGSM